MSISDRSIVFFHPDLGIGGAERLVLDAAVGLQEIGYKVTIFTSHCDPNHCFEEARNGLLDVRVRGNTIIPQTFFGRFWILCAILRQLHLILQITIFSKELQSLDPSVFFVDQLSAGIPLLRLIYSKARILFYCHFPDKYLAKQEGRIKSLYRIPFDTLESWSTGCSDGILVNSKFTKGIFYQAFPSLRNRDPKVVYPCVNTKGSTDNDPNSIDGTLWNGDKILLSINRFERKKDVGLAIRAYALVPNKKRKNSRLVIAGGYDNRVTENVEYHKELQALADSLGISHRTVRSLIPALDFGPEIEVIFFLSAPNSVKEKLLTSATLLIYTPRNEHLGIVPLEAMYAQVPVLAANEGGPTETVVESETGWLRNALDDKEWSRVLDDILSNRINSSTLSRMGDRGKQRVNTLFSKDGMAKRLDEEIKALFSRERSATLLHSGLLAGISITVLGALGVLWALTYHKFVRVE